MSRLDSARGPWLGRLAIFLLVFLPGIDGALAWELDPETYRASLHEIADGLESDATSEARELARRLRDARVRLVDGSVIVTDRPLLDAANSDDPEVRRATIPTLRMLALSLDDQVLSSGGVVPVSVPLRPRPAVTGPRPGGTITTPEVPGFWHRFRQALREMLTGIGELLDELFEWLGGLVDNDSGERSVLGLDSRWVTVLVILLAVLLVVVGLRVLRRGGADLAPPLPTATLVHTTDDDPRSRTADAWVEHARALATAGHHREAVRAWYHAVLSTLVRHGLISWRKDRTNWEYVATLGPELGWRPTFIALTRAFESAWYGRRADGDTARASAAQAETVLRALESRS